MRTYYTDGRTGLSVQVNEDGSFDITAPPAAPSMLPKVVFAGQPTETATAKQQIDAFLAKYGKEDEPEAPEPSEEPTVEVVEKPDVEKPDEDTLPEEPLEESSEDEADADQPKRGKLPEDFPYVDLLIAGDVNTYAKLRKRIEAGTLTEIDHIGDARAAEIEAAFNG